MDFKQLEAFRAIVEKGNFSEAAKSLFISQPAISSRIQNLEDELSVKFFERNNHKIQLTMAGRVFARYVLSILSSYQEGIEMLADLNSLKSGELIIGSSSSFGTYWLPRIIKEFNLCYPDVKIFLEIRNTSIIVNKTLDCEIDLGFHCSPTENEELTSEVIGTDSLIMFTTSEHPLCSKKKITLNDLENAQFIIREIGSDTRSQFDRWCKNKHLKITHVIEINQSEAIRLAVINNTGIAVISAMALQGDSAYSDIKVLDVEGFPISRPIKMLLNPKRMDFLLRDTFAIFARDKMRDFSLIS